MSARSWSQVQQDPSVACSLQWAPESHAIKAASDARLTIELCPLQKPVAITEVSSGPSPEPLCPL